jgi:hypothetical protein
LPLAGPLAALELDKVGAAPEQIPCGARAAAQRCSVLKPAVLGPAVLAAFDDRAGDFARACRSGRNPESKRLAANAGAGRLIARDL